MNRATLLLLLAVSLPQTCRAAMTFDWAYVGNAGNAPDPQTGYGAVSYNYAISKHEVTNAQYAEFLNAVDPTGVNALSLYRTFMSNVYGGIEKFGTIDGARYTIKEGRAQKPVNFVSYLDAMRFTNWLHNGQGPFGSPSGDTETGAYLIGNGLNEVRSTNARYWIPSEDEWYKAAYHDASAGVTGDYYDYATGSDTAPVSAHPADNPAGANYRHLYYAVGPLSYSNDVGAYTGAASPYGTFDQNGNVWEWNEAVVSSTYRGARGGSWYDGSSFLRADNRINIDPALEFVELGFRIATIPEPTALALATMLAGCGLSGRRHA